MDVAIFDIDRTLANGEHRRHLVPKPFTEESWDPYLDEAEGDSPIAVIVELAKMYALRGELIVLFTYRPESNRRKTEKWLFQNNIQYSHLIMRKDGDNRRPFEVKEEMLNDYCFTYSKIKIVFEDDPECVAMFRENNLTCLQVA